MIRAEALVRAGFTALLLYLFSLGATFNAIFIPDFQALSLLLLALIGAGWLLLRWRAGWVWHRTPLDAAFVLWCAAFAVALLGNLTDARRILIGVWYSLLYIAIWYLLTDLLANSGHKRPAIRAALMDAALISGAVVALLGFWQAATSPNPLAARPVSTLGNPNALAAYLVVLVGLAGGRLLSLRAWPGRALGLFSLLTNGLLLLWTASRGGWLGGVAALMTVGALWLHDRDLLRPAHLLVWLRAQRAGVRGLLIAGTLSMLAGLAVMAALVLRSLNEPGRQAELRTFLWDSALTMFAEKPLTGHGLFTYGKGLIRLNSMPPTTPHTHAHSIPLNIAAELGLLGLAALLLTLGIAAWTLRANWRASAERRAERAMLIAGAGGVVGFGAHHLLDLPAMMPAVALIGLLALALTLAPVEPQPLRAAWRRYGHPVAVLALWAILLGTGAWSAAIYRQYNIVVSEAIRSSDFLTGARDLQSVIDAEPHLAVYHWQQAMLYGMAAHQTEDTTIRAEAAAAALAAFDRVLVSNPDNADLHANRAALLNLLGDREAALAAFREATDRAPRAWPLWLAAGRYAEAQGATQAAAEAYTQLIAVVTDNPANADALGVTLHPALTGSPLFAGLPTPPLDGLAEVAVVWQSGDVQAALALWEAGAPWPSGQAAQAAVLRALIARGLGDGAASATWLAQAETTGDTPYEALWLLYGYAALADDMTRPERLAALDAALTPGDWQADYVNGGNLWRGNFSRSTTLRVFLPGVGYEARDPLLLYLRSVL